ncbi:MAG: HAD family phosphatase [Eubacteriales bacterium]|nr:HAD family phosphatase [Eubacteriales bacterium]
MTEGQKQDKTCGSDTGIAVIFDVDGTLLDSLDVWDKAPDMYLRSQGREPEALLGKKLFAMSMEEGSRYLKTAYQLEKRPEEILGDVLKIITRFYREEASLKPGAEAFLRTLAHRKIKMAAATTSDRELVEAAFVRLGIRGYFENIVTCTEVGAGKENPAVYYAACKRLGASPEHTWVFEDAFHALSTAKKAGFLTCGVYDSYHGRTEWEKLCSAADFYMERLDAEAFFAVSGSKTF